MKTILLTSASENVMDEILKLTPKPIKETKIAYITTAANYKNYNIRRDKGLKPLRKIGFKIYPFDIEGKSEQKIRIFLKDKDIIFVSGGNSFYLLNEVKKSGFDKIVKKFVNLGKIYIGASAGSYIACPTIEMANWKHQDQNIVNLKDLTAMNLVPFLVTVHYKTDFKNAVKAGAKKSKYPVKILTDHQAILVQEDNIKLVGKGKEIKI